MRKRKLLLALAMVIAVLSFSFKANAQSTVPIFLTYQASSGTFSEGFEIYLRNNDIQEDFTVYTDSNFMEDTYTYRCGYVPPGNYTVYIRRRGFQAYKRYNWYAYNRGQSATNQLWDTINHYQLLDNIYIGEAWDSPERGLSITLEDW